MSDDMPRMLPSQFKIGDAFTTGSALFRCTDIGSRVVIGIPIDRAEILEMRNGIESPRMVDLREEPSWLIGPPYGVSEIVFDEFDLGTVSLVPEVEVANWRASETL
jgi:hypothetical protein